MSFLQNLRDRANSMIADVTAAASRYKNADFMNATMAVCALVASADGNVDPSEKKKVAGVIGATEALKHFDPLKLKAEFEKHCDAINSDVDFGRLSAMQAVSKLRKTPDAADTAVRIGLIIANADGVFQDSEKTIVRDICGALALQASAYGV